MNTSTLGMIGVRLPLMLLLCFITLIAGVVMWLKLSATDYGVTLDAGTEKNITAVQPKSANKQAVNSGSHPKTSTDVRPHEKNSHDDRKDVTKPARDAQKGAENASHEDESDHGPHASRKSKAPEPTKTKKPKQTAIAPIRTPSEISPRQPTKPVKKVTDPPASAGALTPNISQPVPRDLPLPPLPDLALVQTTALGPLPRVAGDGRLPRQVYAKPFNTADKRPRIAIVVSGLGLSTAATETAIQGLPGSVTLAFAPYSPRLNEWIELARTAGHEVLINIPMEPTNYPAYDPGPQTLLTTLRSEENLDRLLWSLSRGTSYVGVVDFLGSHFTTSQIHMTPVLNAINQRGLLYLDSNSSPRSVSVAVASKLKMVSAKATLTLDKRASRTEIDRRFSELEQHAKRDRRAIGIASPYPVSLERIATWVRQLEARGIAIAPISALTK